MKEYLTFKENKDWAKDHKTKMFLVVNDEGTILGTIQWRNGWRRYVYSTVADIDWSTECLDQLNNFIKKLMEERKEPIPIEEGEHYNCSICGCSHEFYYDAKNCKHTK